MATNKRAFDSNILIDIFNEKVDKVFFTQKFAKYHRYISEITEMELFAKPGMTTQEEGEIRAFLRSFSSLLPLL